SSPDSRRSRGPHLPRFPSPCGAGALARRGLPSPYPTAAALAAAFILSTRSTYFSSFPATPLIPVLVFVIPPPRSREPWPETADCPTDAGRLRFLSRSAPVLCSGDLARAWHRFSVRKSRERQNALCAARRKVWPASFERIQYR